MHVAGPIALYLAAVALCAALALPLLRAAFGTAVRVPLMSLALTAGYPLALVAFSLLARCLPDYAVALPLAALPFAAFALLVDWRRRRQPAGAAGAAGWDRGADAVLLAGFAAVLLPVVAVRSLWPALTWDNSLPWSGIEKLFNLSMIQAFTFGRGFPPENLWHAGQPVDYPVFAHALPGLVAWTLRATFGDAGAAGVLFVFSDAFLFALAGLAVAAWTQALLAADVARRPALVVAGAAGIGALLATSGKAIALVFETLSGGAQPSWVQLQEQAVPFTFSQYPFFTLLLGDHHAFQKVAFLQVAFFGAMALLLTARRFDLSRSALAGGLAAAVALWHSGSVLLAVAVLGPAVAGIVGWQLAGRRWAQARATLVNVAASAAIAAALVLPGWIDRQQPEMRWYLVDGALASPLWSFVLAQAGPLLFVFAGAAAAMTTAAATTPRRRSVAIAAVVVVAIVVVLAVLGRGGIAVAFACAALVLLTAPRRGGDPAANRMPLAILAASGFAIWLLPELVVGDLASRLVAEWKRWQMTMRFWLEGYTLLPFLVAVAWGPAVATALGRPAFARGAAVIGALVCGAWLTAHGVAVADRALRWPDRAGFDGFEFLSRRHACDAAVVGHLRSLQGRVQLGELCGTGEVLASIPVEYAWPGRIAAFSGRPGVCGWSRHVFQFSTRTGADAYAGPWSWVRFREYERTIVLALASAAAGVPQPAAADTLRHFGVTHVVAGGEERRMFPGLTVGSLAAALGGTVSFATADGCGVVELQSSPAPR